MAAAPTLLEPPQIKTDFPVEVGFEVGRGRPRVDFRKRHVDAVEIASGNTVAEVYSKLDGIFATTIALQTVYSWRPPCAGFWFARDKACLR
jgi:hypothetical protein